MSAPHGWDGETEKQTLTLFPCKDNFHVTIGTTTFQWRFTSLAYRA